MTHYRCQAATGLLVGGALLISACSTSGPVQPYAKDVKVDCAGKQDLTASGSTAQANAMTRFVKTYQDACPGKTLTYTANGSGAGIKEFLASKTDFGGSDSPLQGDEYATAKQRCGPSCRVRPDGGHVQPQGCQRPNGSGSASLERIVIRYGDADHRAAGR